MTPAEAAASTQQLLDAYGRRGKRALPAETVKLYEAAFAALEPDVGKATWHYVVNSCTFLPTVAELAQAAHQIRRDFEVQRRAQAAMRDLERMSDHGDPVE